MAAVSFTGFRFSSVRIVRYSLVGILGAGLSVNSLQVQAGNNARDIAAGVAGGVAGLILLEKLSRGSGNYYAVPKRQKIDRGESGESGGKKKLSPDEQTNSGKSGGAAKAAEKFPERPPLVIDPLPSRPLPPVKIETMSPAQRTASFAAGKSSAARGFVAIIGEKTGATSGLNEAAIEELAAAAYDGNADLRAMVVRASATSSMKDDRVQGWIIGEAARKLETLDAQSVAAIAASPAGADNASGLGRLFAEATRDVYWQSLAVVRATALTRSSEDLIGAVNDALGGGSSVGGLETVLADRGKTVIDQLEPHLLAQAEPPASAVSETTARSFELRRTLVLCLVREIPIFLQQGGATARGQVEPAALRNPALAGLPSALMRSLAVHAENKCLPLTGATPGRPGPTSPPQLERKAEVTPGARESTGPTRLTPYDTASRQ